MNLNLFWTHSTRALIAFACFSMMQSCGKKDSDDRQDVVPVAVDPVIELQQDCGDTLKNGESRPLKLYKSEFAPYGQKCADIAFDGQESCVQGSLTLTDNGSATCDETVLKSLKVIGDVRELEVGRNLSLTLEGVDQRGGKIIIPNKSAKWSTTNDFVTVTTNGLVSGKMPLKDVAVIAKLEKFTVQYKFNVTGKSCGETKDSMTAKITRYKSPRVAFGSKCEALQVEALCSNGEFSAPQGTSESCEVAKLTHLEASPQALFLNQGETAKVELFLRDDIGTKIAVNAVDATWELPASGELLHSVGRITARDAIQQETEIRISAAGLSTTVSVAGRRNIPVIREFAQKEIVLKVGDEKTLDVRSTEPVDLNQLNWESSNPSVVSVQNGVVKALVADAEATITARLNNNTIATRVRVEATLGLDFTPVTYAGSQQGKVHPLTQDKPKLLPAYVATVNGLPAGQKPEFASVTEGCRFNARFSREKWELDVQLDENRDTLPANCEAELVMRTEAGQTLTQKFLVPVDYNKVTFVESQPRETAEGLEVGRITYKMSSSYTISSAVVTRLLTPKTSQCEWSLLPDDKSYRVLLAKGTVNGCVARITFKMADANDGLVLTVNELAVASEVRTFEDYCKNPNSNGATATVDAIRKEFGPSVPCDRLAALMRSKNLSALTSTKGFPLALDNRNLVDLNPIARFVGLNELSLANNRQLSDIRALKDLKLLKMLNLKFTAVKDLKPIFEHDLMKDLRLPSELKVSCADEMKNPELKKICY